MCADSVNAEPLLLGEHKANASLHALLSGVVIHQSFILHSEHKTKGVKMMRMRIKEGSW